MARNSEAFRPAFKSAKEVHALVRRRIEERIRKPKVGRVDRQQAFEAGHNLVQGARVRSNLQCIYRWKLGSFVDLFKWVKAFPDAVPEQDLNRAVSLAQKAIENSSDKNAVRAALEAFTAIRGVGVPVASAFLTAMDRKQFTIIDRQAYKALARPFRAEISEYLEYLWFCRQQAKKLDVSLEDHDRALWQRGVEIGRQNRRKQACQDRTARKAAKERQRGLT